VRSFARLENTSPGKAIIAPKKSAKYPEQTREESL
jgi:hypothetical protein